MLASWLWCHRRKIFGVMHHIRQTLTNGWCISRQIRDVHFFSDTPVSMRYSEQDIEQ